MESGMGANGTQVGIYCFESPHGQRFGVLHANGSFAHLPILDSDTAVGNVEGSENKLAIHPLIWGQMRETFPSILSCKEAEKEATETCAKEDVRV